MDLLSDFKREVSRAYGTLLEEKFHSNRSYIVIDRKGIVRWAFAEAACLFLRGSERARQWKQKQEKKHGKAKVLGILAARLARAVYHMLRKQQAFDEDRFWNGPANQTQAATTETKPATARGTRAKTRAAAR